MRQTQRAAQIMQEGGVIAYPTEAVFGLGCDPLNEQAVMRLLHLKNRMPDKGLILIAAAWEQLQPYCAYIPEERLKIILDTWPGPITWIFPATEFVPTWIRGDHSTIAVRVTAHHISSLLCKEFGGPIVSTSANIEGHPPARKAEEVKKIFDAKLDLIIEDLVGELPNPTEIRDALTGKILRAS